MNNMKKYICLIGVIALILGSVLSSCKKYEEDYGLMMKTPKGRLVGTWKIVQIDADTIIKMSDYAMLGELQMTFEKDGTGYIKFKDNGLGEMLAIINWEELLGEYQDSTMNIDSISGGLEGLDFASLLSTETKFKWAFDDKKEYLKFSMYDSTSRSDVSVADMKILSLCKSYCKLRYEDDSTRTDVLMEK